MHGQPAELLSRHQRRKRSKSALKTLYLCYLAFVSCGPLYSTNSKILHGFPFNLAFERFSNRAQMTLSLAFTEVQTHAAPHTMSAHSIFKCFRIQGRTSCHVTRGPLQDRATNQLTLEAPMHSQRFMPCPFAVNLHLLLQYCSCILFSLLQPMPFSPQLAPYASSLTPFYPTCAFLFSPQSLPCVPAVPSYILLFKSGA